MAGGLLIAISLAAVVQSVREYALWQAGANYAEESFLPLPIVFGGHTFTIRDDQPYDSGGSEQEYEGSVQWIRDGVPFESASRARVRRGRNDIGRYHLWLDAWKIRERATGQKTLWLARRRNLSLAVALDSK